MVPYSLNENDFNRASPGNIVFSHIPTRSFAANVATRWYNAVKTALTTAYSSTAEVVGMAIPKDGGLSDINADTNPVIGIAFDTSFRDLPKVDGYIDGTVNYLYRVNMLTYQQRYLVTLSASSLTIASNDKVYVIPSTGLFTNVESGNILISSCRFVANSDPNDFGTIKAPNPDGSYGAFIEVYIGG